MPRQAECEVSTVRREHQTQTAAQPTLSILHSPGSLNREWTHPRWVSLLITTESQENSPQLSPEALLQIPWNLPPTASLGRRESPNFLEHGHRVGRDGKNRAAEILRRSQTLKLHGKESGVTHPQSLHFFQESPTAFHNCANIWE